MTNLESKLQRRTCARKKICSQKETSPMTSTCYRKKTQVAKFLLGLINHA